MITLQTGSHDPAQNLAVEQAVFEALPQGTEALWLWRNDNVVILGRHQHAQEEVDFARARLLGTRIVRRPSGGGAVYHDLGNVNYTYLTDLPEHGTADLDALTRPVRMALESLGVQGEISGRNDILLGGAKISGTAQLRQRGRILFHGTLLFDSDLTRISGLLTPSALKRKGRAVGSMPTRVTNIRPHLLRPLPVEGFTGALESFFEDLYHPEHWMPDAAFRARVEALRRERYDNPDWNIGASPDYNTRNEARFPGGTITAYARLAEGTLQSVTLYGDFFSMGDVAALESALYSVHHEKSALVRALKAIDTGSIIAGLDQNALVDLLMGLEPT